MARKSRRNNNIIEKKQEMMTPEIITEPQLETGVYARLSVEKDNEETIQTQIEMLHQYVEEHGEYHLVDTYVDLTELMGSEIFLYLKVGEQNLTARVSPRSQARSGDSVKVAFDTSRIHLFDKDSEQCILH